MDRAQAARPDGIHYYSDVLRRFVGATENGRRRVFVFRRDPRDISTVERCGYVAPSQRRRDVIGAH